MELRADDSATYFTRDSRVRRMQMSAAPRPRKSAVPPDDLVRVSHYRSSAIRESFEPYDDETCGDFPPLPSPPHRFRRETGGVYYSAERAEPVVRETAA